MAPYTHKACSLVPLSRITLYFFLFLSILDVLKLQVQWTCSRAVGLFWGGGGGAGWRGTLLVWRMHDPSKPRPLCIWPLSTLSACFAISGLSFRLSLGQTQWVSIACLHRTQHCDSDSPVDNVGWRRDTAPFAIISLLLWVVGWGLEWG